jgi:cytochrome bd ubiquinol oxidase subunit I
MHTPQGFIINAEGLFIPTNWFEVIFNPSFKYRYVHMLVACYLTTAFVVLAVGSWYLLKRKFTLEAKIMVSMALVAIVILAPLQPVLGDLHGLNTLKHQPQKIAAIEGLWETQKGAPLILFAIPDRDQEKNHYILEIPKLSSLILTHDLDGEVKGLKAFSKEDRPPVEGVFFSFRIMVSIGLLMLLTAVITVILFIRKKLFAAQLFQRWCVMMAPSGFLAILFGWYTTEIGRQPYLVYGFMRRSEGLSSVPAEQIIFSLSLFVLVYFFIFGMAIYYIFRLIQKGPEQKMSDETFGDHSINKSLTKAVTHGGKND